MLSICLNHSKYVYICPRVTNCPLFYSDEEDVEVEVVEDEVVEDGVVEVAPLLNDGGRGGGGILPGSK